MRRREFIAGLSGTAAWTVAARAQQSPNPTIGWLHPTSSTRSTSDSIRGFRQGLEEVGYVEGRNLAVEYRWANGHRDQLPALAADLVARPVDVIFANAIDAARAAKIATSTIPIVFSTANDPVETGLVTSLNRPGGNVTGVTYLAAALGEKRLELIRELVPTAGKVGVLVNPNNANAEANLRDFHAAAHHLNLQVHVLSAAGRSELESAFARLAQGPVEALVLLNDPLFTEWRAEIIALTARHRVPAIYHFREYAEAGGLMSYGPSRVDAFRQAGIYVGRILNGARPEELPVLQPTTFELVMNMKTANALGLTIPPTLLARADEVIE